MLVRMKLVIVFKIPPKNLQEDPRNCPRRVHVQVNVLPALFLDHLKCTHGVNRCIQEDMDAEPQTASACNDSRWTLLSTVCRFIYVTVKG